MDSSDVVPDLNLNSNPVESRSQLNVNPKVQSNLLFNIREDQCPIIYSTSYDIKFCGIEKLHPFDVTKWGRIHKVDCRILIH